LSVVDPTRFAKEVKEKCGVKAKAVPREKKIEGGRVGSPVACACLV